MPTTINPDIFRAYDIRGVVDVDLNEQIYETLGRASGTFFRRAGRQRLAVARDARLSSLRFQQALIRGLRATGCNVVDIGQVGTPVMYFAVSFLGLDGGAIVSASHNPPQYNGLKLRKGEPEFGGEPLTAAEIQEIGRIAAGGEFETGQGQLEQAEVGDAYVASIGAHLRLPHPVRVVLDAGNGVAGPLAVRAFEAIGCEVVPLYTEPDGTFPNHHPDPNKPENMLDLGRVVRETGAALGIGIDGDGDRLGVVDDQGKLVYADRYLIALAEDILSRRTGAVVFDVKCSSVLADAIRAAGGVPVMSKTGYSSIWSKIRETRAVLGGEFSGHTFGNVRYHYHDDGTFAGAMLLESLTRRGLTLRQALQPYPELPSLDEGRLPFDERRKFELIDFLRESFSPDYTVIAVDGVRVEFGDGWGLVRASNTEPAITTRFEATTLERVQAIRNLMMGKVQEFISARR